jgi:choline dehydrogenase-like flavoprotein
MALFLLTEDLFEDPTEIPARVAAVVEGDEQVVLDALRDFRATYGDMAVGVGFDHERMKVAFPAVVQTFAGKFPALARDEAALNPVNLPPVLFFVHFLVTTRDGCTDHTADVRYVREHGHETVVVVRAVPL